MNTRGMNLKNASSSYTLQELDFYIQPQKQNSVDMERICIPSYKTVNKLRGYQQADYKANNKGKVWLYFLYKILSSRYVILIKDLKTGLQALRVAQEQSASLVFVKS